MRLTDLFGSEHRVDRKSSESYFSDELQHGSVTICKETASFGFAFQEGQWATEEIHEDTFVIRKLEHRSGSDLPALLAERELADDYRECRARIRAEHDWFLDNIALLRRCYQFDEVGEEPARTVLCLEDYDDGQLNYVRCDDDNFSFHPSKLMARRSSWHSLSVGSWPEEEASLFVSHGVCSPL